MVTFKAPPIGTIQRAAPLNPITAIGKSIVGVFIGIVLILLIAPVMLWFAESQNTAKVFSFSEEVASTSGASGYIRTIDIAKADSPIACYESKVEGNCVYYDYTLEELQYEVKDYCGKLQKDQQVIEEKGQKCHLDSNNEEKCEQCYLVNESNWNVAEHVMKFQSFTIGDFKVSYPSKAKVIGAEEYEKQIDATHRESMEYLKDNTQLLVAGSSDGSTISDGGKKKYLLVSSMDYDGTYEALKAQDRFIAWLLRITAFILLVLGYKMIFGPISVMSNFVRKIPLLGKWIDNATDFIIMLVSLLLAIVHFILLWILIMLLKNIVLIAIVVAVGVGLFYLYTRFKKPPQQLPAIVAIMIIVGIVFFSQTYTVSVGQDFAGAAISIKGATPKLSSTTCSDTDGGVDYMTKGTISGGTWKTTGKTYTAKTDSCDSKGRVLEGFCYDSTHGFYGYKSCENVVGFGSVCEDGACTPGPVELCDKNLYFNESIGECQGYLNGTDTDLLADGIYSESVGATTNNVPYSQQLQFLLFSYDMYGRLIASSTETGKFVFFQDDDDAPEADAYFFIDEGPLFTYDLTFDSSVSFDDSSATTAENDLVGTQITMLGKTYTVTGISYDTFWKRLLGLTLEDNDGNEIMIDNNNYLLYFNGLEVERSFANVISSGGSLERILISYSPAIGDEVYLAEGDKLQDPIFGTFTFTFESVEEDNRESIEFASASISRISGSSRGEIIFTNNDGTRVEIPLAADASFMSGEASDEPVFLGYQAPSSTMTNQDQLVYLEGETCEGTSSVVDCQEAIFLVIHAMNAHLVQITNIDTADNTISFDDLTYGTSDASIAYTEGSDTSIHLTGSKLIDILVDESDNSITFSSIGSYDGALIRTQNEAFVTINNNNIDSQTFDGFLITEYDDGKIASYLEEFPVLAVYDDATDNTIEFERDALLDLGSAEGFGLFDESDINDDTQKFMTYKGTLITFDIENQQSVVFEHPENTIYAVVSLG